MVAEDNPYYSSVDGVLFSKDRSILYQYPCMREEIGYIVPEGVNVIGSHAFADSQLQNIIFPQSLVQIQTSAFYASQIRAVDFPEGLIDIGIEAFAQCDELKEVHFPHSLERIQGAAFAACNLEQIELPDNLKVLGTESFYAVPIEENTVITLPASLEFIGDIPFLYGTSGEDTWFPIYQVDEGSYAHRWVQKHNYEYLVVSK